MKKLVACALLGFGLTQVLVGCGDDDDAVDGTSGSSGTATGGTASGGKGSGGSATAGTASGGKATGGTNATAGSAGKGGTATGGTATGGTGNAGGEGGDGNPGGGAGGDAGAEGGMGGAGGAGPVEPDPEPQVATAYWLSQFCDAKSAELLMCESSPAWDICYSTFRPYLSTVADTICPSDDENDPVLTVALIEALDALAAACPDPDVDQWRCTFDGAPQAKDQACRDADDARRVAAMNCGL